MALKAQDVFVALKLAVDPARRSYAELAHELGLSASEVHGAVARLGGARLLDPGSREVRRPALAAFLTFGVPFAFAVRPMEPARGMPTGRSASILGGRLGPDRGPVPVWPDPDGDVAGAAIAPLYRSVPRAARRDPALYALLALVDVLRLEGPNGPSGARDELAARLRTPGAA